MVRSRKNFFRLRLCGAVNPNCGFSAYINNLHWLHSYLDWCNHHFFSVKFLQIFDKRLGILSLNSVPVPRGNLISVPLVWPRNTSTGNRYRCGFVTDSLYLKIYKMVWGSVPDPWLKFFPQLFCLFLAVGKLTLFLKRKRFIKKSLNNRNHVLLIVRLDDGRIPDPYK